MSNKNGIMNSGAAGTAVGAALRQRRARQSACTNGRVKLAVVSLLLSIFASPTIALADRIQGFDRFKFGMTLEEVRTVGPGCWAMQPNGPNSVSALCRGISTPAGGPEFFFDSTSKLLSGIRIDVVGPATEGDARDLIRSLSRKYKSTYQISDGDIPSFFSSRQGDIAVLGAWEDYGVISFAYRYGTSRQYVGIYMMYYSDAAADRMRQRLAPIIGARSGSGIDTSKY